MARSPLLGAVVDEVDQAIAALQTARRFLRELEREAPQVPRLPEQSALDAPVSLRYSGITVAEAAVLLEMSEDHVRKLLRAGELRGAPYSGKIGWRLDAAYVRAVAEQRRTAREGQQRARAVSAPTRKSARRTKPTR